MAGITDSFPTGTTGQLLRAVTNATPTWTTATFPVTAGSSGNVLTSDGTNWTSSTASGAGLLSVTLSLTNSQIKNLHATPIQLVAAPGAGQVLWPLCAIAKLLYGGSNVFTAAAAQSIDIYWATTSKVTTVLDNPSLIKNASTYQNTYPGTNGQLTPITNYENLAWNLYNPVATEISGNAGNNNTITVIAYYFITSI